MKIVNLDSLADIVSSIESGLDEGFKVKLSISGNSMYPFLKHNIHTVYLIKAEKVKKNDIVLFKTSKGNIVLHRIIKIDGNNFVAMGDGNLYKDEEVQLSAIIAKVFAKEKNGKTKEIKGFKNALYNLFWIKMRVFRPILLKTLSLFKK